MKVIDSNYQIHFFYKKYNLYEILTLHEVTIHCGILHVDLLSRTFGHTVNSLISGRLPQSPMVSANRRVESSLK